MEETIITINGENIATIWLIGAIGIALMIVAVKLYKGKIGATATA